MATGVSVDIPVFVICVNYSRFSDKGVFGSPIGITVDEIRKFLRPSGVHGTAYDRSLNDAFCIGRLWNRNNISLLVT